MTQKEIPSGVDVMAILRDYTIKEKKKTTKVFSKQSTSDTSNNPSGSTSSPETESRSARTPQTSSSFSALGKQFGTTFKTTYYLYDHLEDNFWRLQALWCFVLLPTILSSTYFSGLSIDNTPSGSCGRNIGSSSE